MLQDSQYVGVLEDLRSGKKLNRDRGLAALQEWLKKDDGACDQLFSELLAMLGENEWEAKHGALLGLELLIQSGAAEIDPPQSADLAHKARRLLEHREPRVRAVAGALLGTLCRYCGGAGLWERELKTHLVHAIKATLKRDQKYLVQEVLVLRKKVGGRQAYRDESGDPRGDSSDGEITETERSQPMSVDQLFHDTAGWKSLETNYLCLHRVIEGCGIEFIPHLTDELLDLVYTGLKHKNRFVRESGFQTCGAIVDCCAHDQARLEAIAPDLVRRLGTGLADNWSQVRMAASLATRKLLQRLAPETLEASFPVLAPRMCLNRYYVAEGVRLYSQETWELVMGTEGRHVIGRYINQTVAFYVEQSDADNHAVREAACACIAELAQKIDRDALRPHVPQLLSTLLTAFRDESWPVRAASCVASGRFVKCFPEECRERLDELYERFFVHIGDGIWSVREDAAIAIASVVDAYGAEQFSYVYGKLKANLLSVLDQPSDSRAHPGLSGTGPFGVVRDAKLQRDNDPDLHTDQTMYSCGSLAPRLRKGGCMDHSCARPSEPWEVTDGYIYLMRELAAKYPQEIATLLPAVSSAMYVRHYAHHVYLFATVWKQLPAIAAAVGKRAFKAHLSGFFEPLVYSLQSDNQLCGDAAGECYVALAAWLGKSILRGRIEQCDDRYLHVIDGSPFVSTGAMAGPALR